MIFLKITGGALIMAAGAFLALTLGKKDEQRHGQIIGFITLIRYIRKQIECFCLPLGEILSGCDEAVVRSCGYCGKGDYKNGRDAVFEDFLTECGGNMDEDMRSELLRFSSEIGKGYRDEQLRVCDYYISSLEKIKEESEKKLKSQKKLTFTLCLCGAAMSVILII